MLLAGAAGLAPAGPLDDLRRCRAVADERARLACYEAIVVEGALAAATAAPALAPAPAATFGLPKPAPVNEIELLESRLPGRFDGWLPGSRIRLANGQLWQISDGSEAAYRLQDPKVRITRGSMGSFFMQIDGVSQTPRVRRVE